MVFTILILAVFSVLLVITIDWLVHISQVMDTSYRYGWAGFKQFKREFDSVAWVWDRNFGHSLFSESYGCNEFHANIIKFKYNGMIIHNPISFFMVKHYVRRLTAENRKANKVKW